MTVRLAKRAAALVAAVNASPALLKEFQDGWGRESVEQYLAEYRHVPDLVDRLAGDLGVKLS